VRCLEPVEDTRCPGFGLGSKTSVERHTFVQELDGRGLRECGRRAEWDGPRQGWVVDAVYLQRSHPSLFDRWFRRQPREVLSVRLPFDEAGHDTLGLFATQALPLEHGDRQSDGVRVVRGRVSSPGRAQGAILSDFWSSEPSFLRLTGLEDFVVTDESGTPVIVSCGLAPLVVARPWRSTLEEYLARSGPFADDVPLPSLPENTAGFALSLELGDEVEVLGVARSIASSSRRMVFEEWTPAYRSAPRPPTLVIGDEDGTRLVLGIP
jgi:hypothetical protein